MRAGGRPRESWPGPDTASPVLEGVVLKHSGAKAASSAYRSLWAQAYATGIII